MLVMEALMGLWFWSHLSALLLLPSSPVSLLPPMRALESVWNGSPDAAWTDPVQGAGWRTYWPVRTGCCVDFVSKDDAFSCLGKVRLVQQKTMDGPEGLQTAFVVVACGV